MKKILFFVVLLISLFSFSLAFAVDYDAKTGKIYGGYTVVFNPEIGRGFVFANTKRTSVLVVIYPSMNKAYCYGENGQMVFPLDLVTDVLKDSFGAVLDSLVAKVVPSR